MSFLNSAADPQKVRALKFFLIAALAVGALAAAVARPLPVAIAPWLITPLWTLSYGLMAVAAWLAWKRAGLHSPALAAFAVQLAFNPVWRAWPVPPLGAAMDLAMLATVILFVRRNWLAGLTFLPCLAWSVFVSVRL